jgi:uncharacterized RDD family membrane protein YckC
MAFIIDFFITSFINWIIFSLLVIDYTEAGREVLKLSSILALYTHPVVIITNWLYYAILESSQNFQATIGKKLVRIKVVNLNEQKVSFWRATGRFFAKIISAIPLGIGFVFIGFNKHRQGWHDNLAGTYVLIK